MSQPPPPFRGVPLPGVHVNPPAAVTEALHQLQAACAGWPATLKPPPGADLWTTQAMVCSMATGPGFLRWTEDVVVVTVLATVLCLALGWLLLRFIRGTWRVGREITAAIRVRRAEHALDCRADEIIAESRSGRRAPLGTSDGEVP